MGLALIDADIENNNNEAGNNNNNKAGNKGPKTSRIMTWINYMEYKIRIEDDLSCNLNINRLIKRLTSW